MDTNSKTNEDIMPLSPEEIKAIGEIAIGPSRHEQFLNAHYKKLMWGGITLGVVAGAVIAFFSHRNDMRQEAAAQVVQVMKITSPGNGSASAEEFDAAAIQALQQDFASTPSAITAELLNGLSLIARGEEAGIAALEKVAASSAPVPLKARALAAMATYQLQQGKDSMPAWTRITQMEQNPYSALAYLMLGDLSKEKGDKDAARTWYEQCKAKCPTSALVTDKTVEMRLTLLDVDAPTPVEPVAKPEDKANPFEAPFGDTPEVAPVEFNPGF
ncbi:MAG: tetratricopeptide repeat protein [Akkermansia sp.]|nr:tetratricopeptide repeat protein [Akkermansia sp.]